MPNVLFTSFSIRTITVLFVLVLGACASEPKSNMQMAVAEASVQHANTSSTSENANGQLQIALSKLDRARQAVIDKDYERAQQLAEQVELDSQVAELHAQSERSRKAAQETQNAANVLRDEINRKTPH